MKPSVKISVIIPTFNRGAVVCDAIESVLAQTYSDFEIIVVDDGSTDDTKERICASFMDSRVRYIYQNNAGASAARNNGVSVSKGEYVSFLDSDDLWKSKKLEAEVKFFLKNPSIHVVFSNMEIYRAGKFIHKLNDTSKPKFMDLLGGKLSNQESVVFSQREMFISLLADFVVSLCAFTIKRQVYIDLEGLDESYVSAEDWEFFIRLSQIEKFGYIDSSLAIVHLSDDSLHRATVEGSNVRMLKLLTGYMKTAKNDKDATMSLRYSIGNISVRLCRLYIAKQKKRRAVLMSVRGFYLTRNIEFLIRAIAYCFPYQFYKYFKMLYVR